MSRAIEQEIQALTRAFVEDLALLVRQHTLEIVLAQLEAGASARPKRAWAGRGRVRRRPAPASPQARAEAA